MYTIPAALIAFCIFTLALVATQCTNIINVMLTRP